MQVLSQPALDALAGHVAVLDHLGNILLVNRSWRKFADQNEFLGASYGVGSNYIEVCEQATGECSEEAPQVAAGIRTVLAEPRHEFDMEYPCHSPDEQRWFQVRVTGFRESGRNHAVVVHENITAVKKAQQSLALSEARFRLLTECATVAVIILQDRRVVFANPEAERISGWTRDDFQRNDLLQLVHPKLREQAAGWRARPIQDQVTRTRFELMLQVKDGSTRWVDFSSTVLEWEGRPAILGTAMDVTARRNLEEQLRQSQKMEAIGGLAGGIAHDFNNLLNVILGYSELVATKVSDPAARKQITQVMTAAERAAGLTRQLLAFSRKQILQPVVVDLNAVIREMETLLTRLVRADIQIILKLDPQCGRIFADVGQIEQVLMNLMVNASDAMPKGGRLVIETKNRHLHDPASGRFATIPPGRYVVLSFADNGVGMDRQTLDRIFEPFFTTKEQGKGTGLGLATVYGIVKQSGGYIIVYSEPDFGSTFTLMFPRVDAEATSVAKTMPAPESLRGTETVLVVEDEPALRELTVTVLRENGYRVLIAENSAMALEVAAALKGPLDLLVTDVVLPGESGRELSRQLTAAHPNMRTLFVSGYTDDALVPYGVVPAGVSFLQKPFARSDLLMKVREVLGASPAG